MTKYQTIADDIIKRINIGEFNELFKLPIEDELIQYYQVSRNTVRLAIKELIKEGKVYSRQGSGYYIRKHLRNDCISITGTKGLTHDFPDSIFDNHIISLELINADKELSESMLCEEGTLIYRVMRVRIVDGKKYAVEYSYYNKTIVPYLGREIVEKSIYDYLQNDLGLRFGYSDKYINAIKISSEEAKLLDLNKGDPGLVVEDYVFLETGQIFNISRMIYNYKYANFYASVSR